MIVLGVIMLILGALLDIGILDRPYGFTQRPLSGFLVSMATANPLKWI